MSIKSLTCTFIVMCLLLCGSRASCQDGPPELADDPTALLDGNSYLHVLLPATELAARILAGVGNPIFKSDKIIMIQALVARPAAVRILFPTTRYFPEYLPLLKQSTHSFCRIVPPTPPANWDNLIICDPEALRKLDILIRLAHSSQFMKGAMENDWTYMDMIGHVESSPVKLLLVAHPSVADEHMVDHMSYILAFLLAHESWHLTHGAGTNFDSEEDMSALPEPEWNTKLMCRNYESFGREGLSVFSGELVTPAPPVPLDEEGTTEDPALRQRVLATRHVWQEEQDADKFGGETLTEFVGLLKGRTKDEEITFLASEIIQNFGNMALFSWFSRLQPFAQSHCATSANKDFFLTRCMCDDKMIYSQAISLFGSTHPPIILRMRTAAVSFSSEFKKKIGIDLTTSELPNADVARHWLVVIDTFSAVPLKMSFANCWSLTDKVVAGGNIVQILPDLAGFDPTKVNLQYPGYPKDEAQLMRECLATPRPKKKEFRTVPSSIELFPFTKAQSDLLLTRKHTEIPSIKVRDCVFRTAGVNANVASMDQLDKDILYVNAGSESATEFATRYRSQLALDSRNILQIIVKSGVPCETGQF